MPAPHFLPAVLFLALITLASCDRDAGTSGDEPDTAAPEEPRVTLIRNARIYTFDIGDTVLEKGSLAFSADGHIEGIGDDGAMLRAFPDAKVIDLGGKTVLPGLIDSHGHLYGLALSYTQANLVGSESKQEVLQRLLEFEKGLGEGEWLLGRGWDQNDWPDTSFPDRSDLDALFPDRPVWLRRIDGHAAWANSMALAQADRDLSGGWQLDGGMIHRDAEGRPTGIFIDRAMALVEQAVPPLSGALMASALDAAMADLSSLGLTGVHDPGVDQDVIALYREKIAADAFPLRVYAMADGVNETFEWLCDEGAVVDPSGRMVMRSVKLYADGALGSRGAALLEDYSDEAGNRGLLFLQQDELEDQIGRVFACGLQSAVHAIGDAANRQVLDAYAALLPAYPDNPGRHRIEHAQILDPADLPRFAQLGIIAAMQPIHATSDMYWADERLGPERLAGAYAWDSLADSGARLAFGSDFPVEAVNPMLGIYAAVTRQDLVGWPDGGWLPRERLDRAAAVRAYTLGAAWAGFMEDAVGSLEMGKWADFIVLDRDLMRVPESEIPQVQVEQTWVDGRPVYTRQAKP